MTQENPGAGQAAVVLDIGGDVGALVVTMPAAMLDLEVEITPHGPAPAAGHDHGPDATHTHADGTAHTHAPGAPPHVAVVARPTPDGRVVPSLVYPELVAGRYDLAVRPDGPVALTVDVVGGEVTEVAWPAGRPVG